MIIAEKYMSYFGLHFKKLLTWYQSGTRPQNYFYKLYIARTLLGHSEDNILKSPTRNSSLKNMMTFHEQLRFVGKKNVTILSTHNILTQASTSVWNNSRDHLVDFDWQHMLQCVIEFIKYILSPITVNRSNFFFNWVKVCTIRAVFWKKYIFCQSRPSALAATRNKAEEKSEGR